MKSRFARLTVLLLIFTILAGCTTNPLSDGTARADGPILNGLDISQYTIVYSTYSPDYCYRAACYIQSQILERTGVEIPAYAASSGKFEHEILVGDTGRDLSKQLETDNLNMEFSIVADENHIAINGDYFIIAAATYYFVETYIPSDEFSSKIPQEATVHTPITEKANNFIFLIGDGMGFNHTKLFGKLEKPDYVPYFDNEDVFYGYYLPYQGVIRTNSLSGVTDSAAGATALACGYKTANSVLGRDSNGEDVQSLTELAISLGKATAVMSTDIQTGATPAGFSSHTPSRNNTDDILKCQNELKNENGTIFMCDLNGNTEYQAVISKVLERLRASENGFFLMYEEGYIDKHCHSNDLSAAYSKMIRFNQAIGVFMEYAFYHPDTFLIITADHETGGLVFDNTGNPEFTSSEHTGADVPIFAYGQGAEVFANYNEENIMIPKVIASLWGVAEFGQ